MLCRLWHCRPIRARPVRLPNLNMAALWDRGSSLSWVESGGDNSFLGGGYKMHGELSKGRPGVYKPSQTKKYVYFSMWPLRQGTGTKYHLRPLYLSLYSPEPWQKCMIRVKEDVKQSLTIRSCLPPLRALRPCLPAEPFGLGEKSPSHLMISTLPLVGIVDVDGSERCNKQLTLYRQASFRGGTTNLDLCSSC